jgi:hypothetical protein
MLYSEPEIYIFTIKSRAESHLFRLERERFLLTGIEMTILNAELFLGFFEEIRSAKIVRKSVTGTDTVIDTY